MLRRQRIYLAPIVNIHNISDIKFERPFNSNQPTIELIKEQNLKNKKVGQPELSPQALLQQQQQQQNSYNQQLSPTEHTFQKFATYHGLCGVRDFYKGVGQSYYALASCLGNSTETRPPTVVLKEKLSELKNNNNDNNNDGVSSSSSSFTKNNHITVQEDILYNYDLDASAVKKEDQQQQNSSSSSEEDNNKKKDDDEVFVFPAPTKAERGIEWPESMTKESIKRFKDVESIVESTKSELKQERDKNNSSSDNNNNNNTSSSSSPSSSLDDIQQRLCTTTTALHLFRSIFSPVFRDSLYRFAPWNGHFMNVFSATATTGNPLAAPSPEMAQRLYHLLAHDDEKIEAVQLSDFTCVPRKEMTLEIKTTPGGDSTSNKTPQEEITQKVVEELTKSSDYSWMSASPLTTTSGDDSSSIPSSPEELESLQQQRLDKFALNNEISATVNLLIQVPPERYCHNFNYFRTRTRTEGLEEHFDGSIDSVHTAADSTARTLAISNVYGTFRVLEWITKKVLGGKTKNKNTNNNTKKEGDEDSSTTNDDHNNNDSDSNNNNTPKKLIDPRAMPNHMLGLSETFATQPCRVVKSMTLVYNYELKHWRVANVQLNGHYIKDFSLEDWKASGGGTIY